MKPNEEEGVETAREVRGLRETEEEHERKEIAPRPNEEERVDPPCDARGLREVGPGVFLDNEAKGSVVDETPGEEAESEKYLWRQSSLFRGCDHREGTKPTRTLAKEATGS